MQMDEQARIRSAWKAKGDKPCKHPDWDKECYLGSDTGDKVCTTCGRYIDFDKNGKPIPSK